MAIVGDSSHKADQRERVAVQMSAAEPVARAFFFEPVRRNGHL